MEIKQVIFCTLDKQTDLLINEVLDLIPSEIKGFHKQISFLESKGNIANAFENAIISTRTFKGNDNYIPRHLTVGKFFCDFFILVRDFDEEKIISASESFKKAFYKDDSIGEYDEILFNFSEGKTNYQQHQYKISNRDSHGTLISDKELYSKIKYFFLFYLNSDLYENSKLAFTNQSFYFLPMQKCFKSIALDYDGLPIFTLHNLYYELLKEKYIRELLQNADEINPDLFINKVKSISSLEIEELKTPVKPNNHLKLSFFSTKKGRKEELERAIEIAKINFNNFDGDCNTEARKQRIGLEKDINEKLSSKIGSTINEIISSSRSITQLRAYIAKLLDKHGGLYKLAKEKEGEICWPNIFKSSFNKIISNHPNWLIISVISIILLFPEAVNYIFYFPVGIMAKWNILFGIILLGYIIFSIINLRWIKKKFINFYVSHLQRIETYYKESFKSFVGYLGIHILDLFVKKLNSTDSELLKNQIFLALIYLSSYSASQHYASIKKIILEELKNNESFAERLKGMIIKYLKGIGDSNEEIDKISQIKEPSDSCSKLIELLSKRGSESELAKLYLQINEIQNGSKVINIVNHLLDTIRMDYDSTKFLKPLIQDELNFDVRTYLQNQNFNNLITILKSEMNYSTEESRTRLLARKHNLHYLSTSQEIDDNKEMLFLPEVIGSPDIIEYQDHLEIISGFLRIVNLKYEGT